MKWNAIQNMLAQISDLIRNLQRSELYAGCPHCGTEFSLSESILFDGSQLFPPKAEEIRTQMIRIIDKRYAELQKRQISADEGAEKKAIEVGIGKIIEKIVPAYKNFNLPLSDCRFISEPIDMLVFDGASDMNVKKITFMDIKTGNARLNTHQRQIRDAVKDHKVGFEVV